MTRLRAAHRARRFRRLSMMVGLVLIVTAAFVNTICAQESPDLTIPVGARIFVAPMDGGNFVRFTDDNGLKSSPSWAPDGARFAYVLTDSTGSRLILQDRLGQRLQIGTTAPAWVSYFRTTWSADGRLLLYPARKGRTLVALDVAEG